MKRLVRLITAVLLLASLCAAQTSNQASAKIYSAASTAPGIYTGGIVPSYHDFSSGTQGQGGFLVFTNGADTVTGYSAWITQNLFWNGTCWIQVRGAGTSSHAFGVSHHKDFSWNFAAPNGVNNTCVSLAEGANLNAAGFNLKTGTYQVNGSQIAFSNLAGTASATQGGTAQSTWTLGDILYSSAANTLAKLAGNTTTTKKYLSQTGTGAASAAPAWSQIAAADLSDGNTGTGSIVHATSPTVSNETDTGTSQVKRLKANQGTALVAGDFSLSAEWGTTATVSGVTGTDSAFSFQVNSSGTGQANLPTVTLTFHDGTWTNAPYVVCQRDDGSAPNTYFAGSTTATTMVQTLVGTPVATSAYSMQCIVVGR